MKFAATLAVLAATVLPAAFAQTATPKNITVTVGDGGFVFKPDTVQANMGDTVLFKFMGGNHTATQAPFANPCTQAWLDDAKQAGFTTGFQPAANGQAPVVQVRIDSDKPIWVFCQQAKHCNNGMVMVINPPADGSKTLEQFRTNAATAPIPPPGTFANFSASAAANNSTGNSNGKSAAVASLNPKVAAGSFAAAALLVAGLML